MWKVDIYLETDSTFQGKRERKCGYVLATMAKNEEKTKEDFGKSNGTYHQSVLVTLAEALSRMNVSSEICVHTQDGYVASRIPKLEEMAKEDGLKMLLNGSRSIVWLIPFRIHTK